MTGDVLQDGLLAFTDVSRLLERLGAPAVWTVTLFLSEHDVNVQYVHLKR